MQAKNEGDLPERSRYYQAVIDINMIEKGADYQVLKKSYIIFICTFDPFGRGRHIYHFENLCREDPTIRLNDGTEKVFLNTKGVKEANDSLDVEEELSEVRRIYDVVVKYLPDYEPEKILEELLNKR